MNKDIYREILKAAHEWNNLWPMIQDAIQKSIKM